jgi:hypothetical protein
MPLREVKVLYADGTVSYVSMASGLTNKEIRNYFRVGKRFNIGVGDKDKLVAVKKVKILR